MQCLAYNQKQSDTQRHKQHEERETKDDRNWASRYWNSQIQTFKISILITFKEKQD